MKECKTICERGKDNNIALDPIISPFKQIPMSNTEMTDACRFQKAQNDCAFFQNKFLKLIFIFKKNTS